MKVAELIEKLQKRPMDAEIWLEDAAFKLVQLDSVDSDDEHNTVILSVNE